MDRAYEHREVELKPCPVCAGKLSVHTYGDRGAHAAPEFRAVATCPCGFEFDTKTIGDEGDAICALTAVLNERGDVSDGYHTFDELYEHRCALTAALCNAFPERAYKSRQHHDGSMFEGDFIVSYETERGPITYHYNLEYWDWFDIEEREMADVWDGATPEDTIFRLTGSCSRIGQF